MQLRHSLETLGTTEVWRTCFFAGRAWPRACTRPEPHSTLRRPRRPEQKADNDETYDRRLYCRTPAGVHGIRVRWVLLQCARLAGAPRPERRGCLRAWLCRRGARCDGGALPTQRGEAR